MNRKQFNDMCMKKSMCKLKKYINEQSVRV